jgi:hypothetical protein
MWKATLRRIFEEIINEGLLDVADDFSRLVVVRQGGLRTQAVPQAQQGASQVRRAHRHHPVHGPDTEVETATVFADFLALLDTRDREIVVILNGGTTKLTEVADILGYANHSAVSKQLKRIRELVEQRQLLGGGTAGR